MNLDILAQTIFSSIANGVLYAFVGLGFGLVHRSTGIINFAQGDLAMLGAVTTGALVYTGLPVGLAVVAAVAMCGLLSGAFYLLALRPASRASIAQSVIMTIGFSILIRGGVIMAWGSSPVSVPGFTGDAPFNVLGASILPQEIWLIGSLILVAALTAWFFQYTVIGLALRAGASNALGAAFVGIDARRLGLFAFIAAGLLGGLGGAIWSPISLAQVDFGLALSLKGFTAAAIGGFASPYGPIVGGLILGLAEGFGNGFISSAWQEAITFGLLILVLVVRPQGFLGKPVRQSADDRGEEAHSMSVRPTTVVPADWWHLALGIVVLGALPFLLSGVWLTTAIFTLITAIVVMGLVVLTGFGGQLSLGQGAFMMVGAYVSGYFTVHMGWSPLPAMALGCVLAVALALVLGRIIFRLRGYYLSMASLGLLMIALTLARELTEFTGGANGLPGIPPISLFGVSFFRDQHFYYLAMVASLVSLGLCLALVRSRFGRALLAIRSSESAALSCAVDVVSMKMRSFAFSAALASFAGSLYVHYLGIANPAPFGLDASIVQLTALTVGGALSLWGSYFGAALVLLLPVLIGWVGGSAATQMVAGIQYTVFGLVLIGAVVLRSTNIMQSVSSCFRRRTVPSATEQPQAVRP